MKGIVLAGGSGSRLQPLTSSTNKHLLHVYNKKMIEIPIETLTSLGLDEIVVITGGRYAGGFLDLLGSGKNFGIKKLFYTYQEGNGGICDALKLAEPFVDRAENSVVILGDNYFEDGIKDQFLSWTKRKKDHILGASCILKEVTEPWHFGIAEVLEDQIVSLEEKPTKAKSQLAVTGCYFLDWQIWDWLRDLKPSSRGELEITDLLSKYKGQLSYSTYPGYWNDMGTFNSLMEVSQRIYKKCQTEKKS